MEIGFQNISLNQLVKADWNYKRDNDVLLPKLIENIKKNGQIENIIVRELDSGFYEVVNGNHRFDAMQQLNIDTVYAYNLGKISLPQAQRISIETNETRFESDNLKLAELMINMTEIFSAEDIEGFNNMFVQDWEAANGNKPPQSFQEFDEDIQTDFCCPKCHYTWSGISK